MHRGLPLLIFPKFVLCGIGRSTLDTVILGGLEYQTVLILTLLHWKHLTLTLTLILICLKTLVEPEVIQLVHA